MLKSRARACACLSFIFLPESKCISLRRHRFIGSSSPRHTSKRLHARAPLRRAKASIRVVELYIGCSRGCAETAAMAFLIDGQIDTRLTFSLLKLHITNASTVPGAYESSFCFLNSFHINLASSHCLISIVLNSILLFVGSLVCI